MISCLFPYWEEGNHDGHKKGYIVVHLGDRSFTFFMAIKRPAWNAQGLFSVLLPWTNPALLDLPRAKLGIIQTRNHNHGNATLKAKANVRPFMSSKKCVYSREKATRISK